MLHYTGDINKYINMKYAYLSISAVVIMGLLSIFEFVRVSRQQIAEEKRRRRLPQGDMQKSWNAVMKHMMITLIIMIMATPMATIRG